MAVKSVELGNPDGCLGKAAMDEPLFVLRANDEVAPMAVRTWAQAYRFSKEQRNEFGPKQRAKYQEAMTLAIHMENWKRDHP